MSFIKLILMSCVVSVAFGGRLGYGARYRPIYAYAAEDHPVIEPAVIPIEDPPTLVKPIVDVQPVYGNEIKGAGMPYQFGYQIKDDDGNTQHRQEAGDETGAVKGSYGYQDAFGVYRQVHYIADADGFRAVVKTNEPGTENKDPADVSIQAEDPPAVVQEKTAHASASKINLPYGISRGYSEPYHYIAPKPSGYGYLLPHATSPIARYAPKTRVIYRKPIVLPRYAHHY